MPHNTTLCAQPVEHHRPKAVSTTTQPADCSDNSDDWRSLYESLVGEPQWVLERARAVLQDAQETPQRRILARGVMGRALTLTDRTPAGLRELHSAIDEAEAGGWCGVSCQLHIVVAETLTHSLGDLDQALKVFERAQHLAEQISDSSLMARSYASMGPLLGRMGRMSECEAMLRMAMQHLDPTTDRLAVQKATLNLAHLLNETLRPALALQTLNQAQPLIHNHEEMPRRVVERTTAKALAQLGHFEQAIALLETQLCRLDPERDAIDWIENHLCLGAVLLNNQRENQAIVSLEPALQVARRKDLHAPERDALTLLAQAYEATGDLLKALTTERALRLAQQQAIDRDTAERARVLAITAQLTEEKIAQRILTQTNQALEARVQERTMALEREIGERIEAERLARHWAQHDWLTGLSNRSHLDQYLTEQLSRSAAAQQHTAVLFLDLDGFKTLNDSFGHMAGDRVLDTLARRLSHLTPADALVARYGGDEFVIVMPIAAETTSALYAAKELAHRLVPALSAPILLEGAEVRLSACIGIAVSPHDGEDPGTLLRNADRAMLEGKKAGAGHIRVLDATTRIELARLATLRRDLEPAIAQRKLEAWFQPIMDLRTGRVRALELLARWHHPELGWISPSEFVPMTEERGCSGALGHWALEQAVVAASALRASFPLKININLSPLALTQTDLATSYRDRVRALGGQAYWLCFELTESVQLASDPQCRRNLEALRAAGFSLALDDFGAGYSSFSYLSQIRFDQLKIDRSLVVASVQDDQSETVLASVITMAQAMSMDVVAEGVETQAQFDLLRHRGCDSIQGYWIARPMPLAALTTWLKDHSHVDVSSHRSADLGSLPEPRKPVWIG